MCLIRSSGCSRRSACRIESSLYVVAVLPPAPPAAAIAQPRGRLGPVPLSPTHPALQPLSRQWRELGDAERHRQKHRRRYSRVPSWASTRPHGELEQRTCACRLPACCTFPVSGHSRSLSDFSLTVTLCVCRLAHTASFSEPVSRSVWCLQQGTPPCDRPLVGGFRVYRAFTVWPPFAAAWQR